MNLLFHWFSDRQLNFRVVYTIAIVLALTVSFIAGLAYTGKQYIFWIFCISANVMLYYGISQKKSFGFLILCIFLWLGYWLKSITHLLIDYPFREPMGQFSFTAVEWDKFYLIASLGMLVTMMSGFFLSRLNRQLFLDRPTRVLLGIRDKCSLRALWVLGIVGAVGLCAVNFQFHFIAIGLHPSSPYLPWAITSLFSWLLGFGVISSFYAFLDIDLRTNSSFVLKSILVLFIFLLLSISQSSRSVLVLSGLPMFLGLMTVYKKPVKKIIPILLVYLLFIILAVSGSNYRRYEQDLNAPQNQTSLSSRLISSISALAVDRWIGLEGLASVVSYPNKSHDLLLSSLTEKKVRGTIDSYTLNVAQAFKDAPEKSRAISLQYASIAGLFGFFYLSNSLLLFCLGIFAVVGLIIFSEKATLFFTDNRMLSLCWSTSFVFTLSSLTIGVPQIARYYLFSFIVMNVFGFLLRKYCLLYKIH